MGYVVETFGKAFAFCFLSLPSSSLPITQPPITLLKKEANFFTAAETDDVSLTPHTHEGPGATGLAL